jgi:hypothetical protein
MRKELAKTEGERKKFLAVFSRVGKKTGYRGYSEETILLKNIKDQETNQLVADHIWFGFTKGFQEAGLREGNRVEFEARVKKYLKGYRNPGVTKNHKTLDYRLSHPTKIRNLS